MLKRIIHILLLLVINYNVHAQLQPLLDQYNMNGLAINPAYAGSKDALSVGLYSRIQWVGFDGAPKTYTFSAHSPIRNKKVNLGVIVLNDRVGSKNETGILFNYAYRVELGKGKLALGLAAGITTISTDINEIRYTDANDDLIQNLPTRTTMPEFSFGMYYHSKKWFLGLSMPMFLTRNINEPNTNYKSVFDFATSNYFVTGGYKFNISDAIDIVPSMLLKAIPANDIQTDIHCDAVYKKTIWLGSTIRTNGSFSAQLQVQINQQLRIGYTYSDGFSGLSKFQDGSHELAIQYSFKYLIEVISPKHF